MSVYQSVCLFFSLSIFLSVLETVFFCLSVQVYVSACLSSCMSVSQCGSVGGSRARYSWLQVDIVNVVGINIDKGIGISIGIGVATSTVLKIRILLVLSVDHYNGNLGIQATFYSSHKITSLTWFVCFSKDLCTLGIRKVIRKIFKKIICFEDLDRYLQSQETLDILKIFFSFVYC